MQHPSAIGVFSGLGGLEIGLQKAGFKIQCSLDSDLDCCRSLRMNHRRRRVVCRDISEISGNELLRGAQIRRGSLALLAGGPPCQPFSRSNEGRRRGLRDSRGRLVWEMVRLADETEPRIILIENVPGLLSAEGGCVIRQLVKDLAGLGYSVEYSLLNSASYGIPQRRKRLFVVGTRTDARFEFPSPSHGPGLNPYVTAKDAIGDLDDGITCRGADSIGGKYGHLVDAIPEGMNYLYYTKEVGYPKPRFRWRSKYWHFLLKLDRNQPSSTIQANPGPYVGPIHWRNRHLTLREAMRIQTLPDEIKVSGSRGTAWQQIGNAVPPVLAEAVGRQLCKNILTSI